MSIHLPRYDRSATLCKFSNILDRRERMSADRLVRLYGIKGAMMIVGRTMDFLDMRRSNLIGWRDFSDRRYRQSEYLDLVGAIFAERRLFIALEFALIEEKRQERAA